MDGFILKCPLNITMLEVPHFEIARQLAPFFVPRVAESDEDRPNKVYPIQRSSWFSDVFYISQDPRPGVFKCKSNCSCHCHLHVSLPKLDTWILSNRPAHPGKWVYLQLLIVGL